MIESELSSGSENVAAADIAQARKTVATTTIRLAREGGFDLPAAQTADAA